MGEPYFGFELQPVPDEMSFGVIVTAGVLSGCENYAQAYSMLLNARSVSPIALAPPGFRATMGALNSRYRRDQLAFEVERTYLPYYWNWLDVSDLAGFRKSIEADRGIAIRACFAQRMKRVEGFRYIQVCSDCAQEQLDRHRRATWLRSHNLPGVLVCYRHGNRLLETDIAAEISCGTYSQRVNFPASSGKKVTSPVWNPDEPWSREVPYQLIAQISHEVISDIDYCNTESVWNSVYRGRIAEKLGCPENFPDWPGLQALMRDTYGDLIPSRLGIDFGADNFRHWLRRIIGFGEPVRTPLLHVLLIGALFASYDDLKGEIRIELNRSRESRSNIGDEPGDVPNNEAPARVILQAEARSVDQSERDKEIRRHLLTLHRSTLATFLAANPSATRSDVKSSLQACYRWLRNHDFEWANANLPPRTRRVPLSSDVEKLHLDLHAKHRQALLNYRAANPSANRKGIRQNLPGCHSWLRKYDAEWLANNLPDPAKRVHTRAKSSERRLNWEEIDTQVAKALSKVECAAKGYRLEGSLGVCFQDVARKAGIKYVRLLQLRDHPRTRAELDRLVSLQDSSVRISA